MTIWSCKPLALAALLGVAGCAEIAPALPFLPPAGGALFGGKALDASGVASMARGRVQLVPPEGYCIDPDTLKAHFAVLARCEVLQDKAPKQNPGLITVSLMRAKDDDDPGRILHLMQATVAEPQISLVEGDLALAQIDAPAPDGADRKHWRGVGRVGSMLIGMAYYTPSAQADGGEALRMLFLRTEQASGGPE